MNESFDNSHRVFLLQMTVGKSIHLLLVILSSMSVVSRSYVPEATGNNYIM